MYYTRFTQNPFWTHPQCPRLKVEGQKRFSFFYWDTPKNGYVCWILSFHWLVQEKTRLAILYSQVDDGWAARHFFFKLNLTTCWKCPFKKEINNREESLSLVSSGWWCIILIDDCIIIMMTSRNFGRYVLLFDKIIIIFFFSLGWKTGFDSGILAIGLKWSSTTSCPQSVAN